MTGAVVVGLLVVLAVLVGGPASRELPAAPGPPGRPRGRAPGGRGRFRRERHPRRDVDLGVLVTEVATRLRTGATVEGAWRQSLARVGLGAGDGTGDDGVPTALLDLARHEHDRARLPAPLRRLRPAAGPGTAAALPGTVAACRLTNELGAPLADVLDRCAAGLTEAGQAHAARTVALAGPRATARLLGWLPLTGLLLGAGVGADPVSVLLGGGLGSACLTAGLVLIVLGRRWVRSLERAAGNAGSSPAGASATGARSRLGRRR